MTAPTITLVDVGAVPALPDNLIPIALAVRDVPERTWSVVACPDDGPPVLHATELTSSVAAGRIAASLTLTYGPLVFIAYRCPTSVTVSGAHPELAGNLIGSVTVDPARHRRINSEWRRITQMQRAAEDDHLVIDAMRQAHNLAAGTPTGQVLLHALTHPVDDYAYLTAYTYLVALDLHRHALAHHRRERTHRCPTCRSRVWLIRANVAEAMGNPCNNGWHDQV